MLWFPGPAHLLTTTGCKGENEGKKKKDLIIDLTSSRPPPLVFPSHVRRLPFLAQRCDTMRRRRLSTRANTGARVRGKGFRFNFPLAAVVPLPAPGDAPRALVAKGWRCQQKKHLQVYPSPPTKEPCRRTDKNATQAVQAYRVWRRVPLPENACRRPPYSSWPPATKVVVGGFVWLAHEPLGHELGHVGRYGYRSLGPRRVRPSFVNFDRAPGP